MNYIAKILMNYLYGRFGMDDNFKITKILDDNTLSKLIKKSDLKIINIKELGLLNLVQYKEDNLENTLNNEYNTHNVNVAISSAITSYAPCGAQARIHMSPFRLLFLN